LNLIFGYTAGTRCPLARRSLSTGRSFTRRLVGEGGSTRRKPVSPPDILRLRKSSRCFVCGETDLPLAGYALIRLLFVASANPTFAPAASPHGSQSHGYN